jgi:hypothetical protein
MCTLTAERNGEKLVSLHHTSATQKWICNAQQTAAMWVHDDVATGMGVLVAPNTQQFHRCPSVPAVRVQRPLSEEEASTKIALLHLCVSSSKCCFGPNDSSPTSFLLSCCCRDKVLLFLLVEKQQAMRGFSNC